MRASFRLRCFCSFAASPTLDAAGFVHARMSCTPTTMQTFSVLHANATSSLRSKNVRKKKSPKKSSKSTDSIRRAHQCRSNKTDKSLLLMLMCETMLYEPCFDDWTNRIKLSTDFCFHACMRCTLDHVSGNIISMFSKLCVRLAMCRRESRTVCEVAGVFWKMKVPCAVDQKDGEVEFAVGMQYW
jgi:hypothetical protein